MSGVSEEGRKGSFMSSQLVPTLCEATVTVPVLCAPIIPLIRTKRGILDTLPGLDHVATHIFTTLQSYMSTTLQE